MSQGPSGMVRATGTRTSRKNSVLSAWSSSVAVTSSVRRPAVIVAVPAARRLRTQSTSPNGAQIQRLPECSTMASGVVRGRPLVRPRMVTSTLGPMGVPARSSRRAKTLKNGT